MVDNCDIFKSTKVGKLQFSFNIVGISRNMSNEPELPSRPKDSPLSPVVDDVNHSR